MQSPFSRAARAASCTFHDHLEHFRGPTGGDWNVGSNWIGGNVPGPGDTAVIKGLTGSGLVSLNSGGALSVGSLTTDSTTSLEVISGSLSLGVASSSTLGGPVTVQAGATLSVGSASSVTIGGGQTLTDNGTFSFATGDTLTLSDPCCNSPSQISVSGSLTANGTTFSGDSRTTFTITPTGTISGGGNTFNLAVIVPYNDVSALAGNPALNRSRSVPPLCPWHALAQLDRQHHHEPEFNVFPNGFTVASGATLAVGPNVAVVMSGGQTLSVAGTLSFATGDWSPSATPAAIVRQRFPSAAA